MPSSLRTIQTSAGILMGRPTGKPAAMSLALAVALATGIFAVPSAEAKPEMAGQNAETRFSAMDGNKDGKVSREEFFAAQPNMKEGAFAAIDTDNDGILTLKEWQAFFSDHGKGGAMGGMGGGMPPSMPEGAAGKSDAASPASGSGQTPGQAPAANGTAKAPGLIMPPRDSQ